MSDKEFYKKHIQECLEDIKKNDWNEEDYDTLIGYCNIIVADILEIREGSQRITTDKIIVEFERKELEKVCYDEDDAGCDEYCWRCWHLNECIRDAQSLIKCLFHRSDIKYKIKEQK